MPALKHGISFVPIHLPALLATQAANLRKRRPSRKMTRSWRSRLIKTDTSDAPPSSDRGMRQRTARSGPDQVSVAKHFVSRACSIVLSASGQSLMHEGATILNLPTRPARDPAKSVPSFTQNDRPRSREIDTHHHAKHAGLRNRYGVSLILRYCRASHTAERL
jgi:hypothetical protein